LVGFKASNISAWESSSQVGSSAFLH